MLDRTKDAGRDVKKRGFYQTGVKTFWLPQDRLKPTGSPWGTNQPGFKSTLSKSRTLLPDLVS